MAKVQIIMPVTLDGFLPEKNEELMEWAQDRPERIPLLGRTGYIQHVSALWYA